MTAYSIRCPKVELTTTFGTHTALDSCSQVVKVFLRTGENPNTMVPFAVDVELKPGCELRHSRAARGEDLLLLPSLLAASPAAPGTYIDEARAVPYYSLLATCYLLLTSHCSQRLHRRGAQP